MLTLAHPKPVLPPHVVIMGSGGFVGRASVKRLQAAGLTAVALTRREVDLLAPEAASKLRGHLTSSTTLIVTSALAPVKSTPMLLDNLRMMQAVIEAVRAVPVRHVVYISSDAVYKDSSEPLTENSCAEPGSLH